MSSTVNGLKILIAKVLCSIFLFFFHFSNNLAADPAHFQYTPIASHFKFQGFSAASYYRNSNNTDINNVNAL